MVTGAICSIALTDQGQVIMDIWRELGLSLILNENRIFTGRDRGVECGKQYKPKAIEMLKGQNLKLLNSE